MEFYFLDKGGREIKRFIILITLISFMNFGLPSSTNATPTSIQELIDKAEPGDTIEVIEGEYQENIVIDKPLKIIGSNNVELTSQGTEPAIQIESDDVMLENIKVKHINKENSSSAILIKADHNVLSQLQIETVSYGIQLDEADHNTLSNIKIIGAKEESIMNRKHGLDLWKSHNNTIYNINIEYVQDGIYVERSNENKILDSTITKSRYGIHLMFTKKTKLHANESYENISGIYIMGAEKTVVKNNIVRNNQKNVQSLGILVFDTADAQVIENNILYNRIGILIESAEDNDINLNQIQENYIGVQFKDSKNNRINNNSFIANVVPGQMNQSSKNNMDENFWGDHLGIDITGNNKSDLKYKIDPFFLELTNEFPSFQLLFQSPGLYFLEQLFHTPKEEQLIDNSPLMENPIVISKEQEAIYQVTALGFSILLLIVSMSIIYMGVKER